ASGIALGRRACRGGERSHCPPRAGQAQRQRAGSAAAMRLDLGIETSTQIGSIALSNGETELSETVLGAHTRHAEALLPALEAMLKSSAATTQDIARIAVGGGPGSFTGLRIAAATAKGLVHALGVPLYAYSGLLVAAARSELRGKPVCALFD